MNSSVELITTENLSKVFIVKKGLFSEKAHIRAVDNVNISIKNNMVYSVVGESGSGKSTLSRLILKLLEPTTGKVYFKGKDLASFNKVELKAFRRSVQVVFQDPFASLNPRQSIYSAIAEPLKIHGIVPDSEIKERVAELLESVGLKAEHMYRYPHEFSGGQRQRICIARALALMPELIVADEPLSSLDVSIQAQILNLLAELKEKNKLSFLFISHDLNVVRYFSDYVAVMYSGVIVEEAKAEELFDNPLHPYTRLLLESAPSLTKETIQRQYHSCCIKEAASEKGCAFYPRCPDAINECNHLKPELVEKQGRKVACFRV